MSNRQSIKTKSFTSSSYLDNRKETIIDHSISYIDSTLHLVFDCCVSGLSLSIHLQ